MILLGLVATALLVAPFLADAAGLSVRSVRGDLTAVDEDSDAKGRFTLLTLASGRRGSEKLFIEVKGLDKDTEYEVLLGEDVDDAASFGEITIRGRRGAGRFRFSSRRDDYPDGVDGLDDFSGDSIFVVAGDETVLEGDIPAFAGLDDEEVDEGALAFGFGKEKLSPPEDDDSRARGWLLTAAVNSSRGSREWLSVTVIFLDKDEEYDVVLLGEDGGDDETLGTIDPRSRLGLGALILDTARDDELPDHPSDLAGRGIEVRDSDGNVVLEGEFPALE
jgi:hypothetical protein